MNWLIFTHSQGIFSSMRVNLIWRTKTDVKIKKKIYIFSWGFLFVFFIFLPYTCIFHWEMYVFFYHLLTQAFIFFRFACLLFFFLSFNLLFSLYQCFSASPLSATHFSTSSFSSKCSCHLTLQAQWIVMRLVNSQTPEKISCQKPTDALALIQNFFGPMKSSDKCDVNNSTRAGKPKQKSKGALFVLLWIGKLFAHSSWADWGRVWAIT